MKAPTERFSDRVFNYVRYRPAYPKPLVETLVNECCLDENSIVADIGSGTGIFSRQLLNENLRVFAVEPNQEMREASENDLSGYKNFSSVDGSAEATTLPDDRYDLVTAAQAFHWFRYDGAQAEFDRILKSGGRVALIWNQRDMRQEFQKDYETLLNKHATDYTTVNHMNISAEKIMRFFSGGGYQNFVFENRQVFDRAGFLGRMRSSSYIPSVGSPELWESADQLFAKHSSQGKVSFGYESWLHIGRVGGSSIGS
jgi:ubiquinone/menaquinone biosynthesis C-methylase UbiE